MQGEDIVTELNAVTFDPSQERDERIQIKALKESTRFILLAGKPLKEPVTNYGPFVMSSDEEIY